MPKKHRKLKKKGALEEYKNYSNPEDVYGNATQD